MPPAATNENVEDVLASIRRIVAEESGASAEPKQQAAPAQRTVEPDPGLLQATFRVDAEPAEPALQTISQAPAQAKQEPQQEPDPVQPPALSVEEEQRRLAVFMEVRRQYEARVAAKKASAREEETSDPELCKLLLTEDFQVRAPELDPVVHPAAPAARQGYAEDSDRTEAADSRVTLESVVRTAVADSVRAALNGAMVDDDDELLDDDGYIDSETLRALVISIVHEELRGELGSQISARVRKLVRQEINRALQLQSLDYR
jgi:cell pole-organizing protein PopZ